MVTALPRPTLTKWKHLISAFIDTSTNKGFAINVYIIIAIYEETID